ncbi:hypothetical protein MSAN_01025400 [Mycena sanguinolenta]|uniref:Uncharacterized protein n=1 Tax=Mycena sanguinolenta TaxID=230812 RepID=A0A8H6YSC0_9AGAR|nr:hypothetical protein MSAN_01025400 [Mycena sanguinolenta]
MDCSTVEMQPRDQIDLLSLPPEIRLKIWTPVLQPTYYETAEQVPNLSKYINDRLVDPPELMRELAEASYLPSACCSKIDNRPPRSSLLLVCRQIHTEATPLLYANTLIVETPTGPARQQDFLEAHATLVERLRRPRPLPLRRVLLLVHGGDGYSSSADVIAADAPRIAELCDALVVAAQGSPFERVHMYLIDWTTYEVFGRTQPALGVALLRGLGLLHCAKTSTTMVAHPICDNLEWAMQQPGRTMPLLWLHGELEAFLKKYQPDGDGNGEVENTKAFFLRRSNEAADRLNGELFSFNFEAALGSVAGKAEESEVNRLRRLPFGDHLFEQ